MRIFLAFLLFPVLFYAQNIIIFDMETGKPIKEVAVFSKDQLTSSISNKKGRVDISDFKMAETIYFSHVSYAPFHQKKSHILQNDAAVYLSKHSEQLDEIVITVFKNKSKTKRIAEQIAVINKKEIEKFSPQTTADLLANIPGIKVQKSQFGGGSPVLRGMESNRVLLVVDGVRMNNAIYRKGHLQNAITVSPNLLDRTEVVFGPSSVIYGSDALGGVVHYYTKTPKLSEKKRINSSLFTRFSTVNNETTNVVSVSFRFPKWASFTSVSYSNFGDLTMGKNRSHDFKNWGKVAFYSENVKGNYAEKPTPNTDKNIQRNTGFSQTDILQKFYVPLSKTTDLKINIQYSKSSDIPRFDKLTEYKKGSLKFAEWYYGPQERLLISPQIDIQSVKKWLNNGTITLAYQNIKESRIQRKFNSLVRLYRKEDVDVFSVNGDFRVSSPKKRNLLYGFEFTYNDLISNAFGKKLDVTDGIIKGFSDTFKIQSRYPDGGGAYFSSSLYVDYRQNVSQKATLNTGIRLTNTHLCAKWVDEKFIKLPKKDIHINNTAVTATIGYVYKPLQDWQLNAVLSSGFRSPNLDDIGKVREKKGKITVPNICLKPEHAYNAEIGIQKYFNDKKFRIGVNMYYTLLKNYIYRERFLLRGSSQIMYDGEAGTIIANVNKGNAYVTGFTISYQGKLSNRFTTMGSVTFTEGETYDTKEKLSSIPPLFGNFSANYLWEKLETGVDIRFNAKKNIADYNLTEGIDNPNQTPIVNHRATEDIVKYYGTPSWAILGIFAKYNISPTFYVQSRISNLFDSHYKEFASGISAPGRNLSISLNVTL